MKGKYLSEENVQSPGILFQKLGIGEVYVHREGGVYGGTISTLDLDESIRNRGRAEVWRGFTTRGERVFIRFKSTIGDTYKCQWIVFDYVLGIFFVGVSKNASAKIKFLSMDEMIQMGVVLQKTYPSLFLPPV